MSDNYLIYPCKVMRITQTYKGTTSHLPHSQGTPKDYPIDEGCTDSGRDYIYCPCDSMSVKRIYGVGASGVNTIFLESDSKVAFADGTKDYFTMLITHPDDSDLGKISVGQKFIRKEKICREGKDGASAYHFHISAGKGLYKGSGWTKNTKGKWVLTTTKSTEKPEKLFFVDESFTKIISDKGLSFRKLSEVKNEADGKNEKYRKGTYKVNAELLNVRRGPSTEYGRKDFSELTVNARKKILSLTNGVAKDGYVKGLVFSVSETSENFGKTPSGWVCLDYCEVVS